MLRPGGALQPLEYLIVLEVAARPRGRDRERLRRSLRHHPAEAVDEAVRSLEGAGVVRATERTVRPSDALRRLDELGLINV